MESAAFAITPANGCLFSDKGDKTVGPVSQLFIVHNSAGRKRTHALFEKSRARDSRCFSLTLLSRSLAKRGRPSVMFPKRLVVYEAALAKSATSQRDITEC